MRNVIKVSDEILIQFLLGIRNKFSYGAPFWAFISKSLGDSLERWFCNMCRIVAGARKRVSRNLVYGALGLCTVKEFVNYMFLNRVISHDFGKMWKIAEFKDKKESMPVVDFSGPTLRNSTLRSSQASREKFRLSQLPHMDSFLLVILEKHSNLRPQSFIQGMPLREFRKEMNVIRSKDVWQPKERYAIFERDLREKGIFSS